MQKQKENILAVDLDGTLLKSNVLLETFWFVCGHNFFKALYSIFLLLKSKAALKNYLAYNSNIDVASLPYDQKIISYLKIFRKAGGKTVLITASSEILAIKISKYLKIFDYVYGSNEKTNLKGIKKAKLLTEKFGSNNFEYMGDSYDDILVWKTSKKIITVNISKKLKEKIDSTNKPKEHLMTRAFSILNYLKTLRIHQWLKNTIIFFPIIIVQKFEIQPLFYTFLAFCSFSFIASSSYIINDLLDLNSDRLHKNKYSRPFASGDIPIEHASILILIMLIASITIAYFINTSFLFIIIFYFLLSQTYSIFFKKIIVLDLFVISSLFTIRIFAGGTAANILISEWLITFSIFFFLSLATIKRQAELIHLKQIKKTLALGRGYKVDDLPIINLIALTTGYISVLILTLYINSISAIQLFNQIYAIWGICFVLLYWITKLVFVTNRGHMTDDPIIYALTNKSSLSCFFIILCLFIFGII